MNLCELKADVWVAPLEDVNHQLWTNCAYDSENGTDYGCILAKQLIKSLESLLEEKGD